MAHINISFDIEEMAIINLVVMSHRMFPIRRCKFSRNLDNHLIEWCLVRILIQGQQLPTSTKSVIIHNDLINNVFMI